ARKCADKRCRREDQEATSLARQLASVPDGTCNSGRNQPHRVTHRGGDRWNTERHQRGEGNEGAGPHNRVNGSGPGARNKHQHHFGKAHTSSSNRAATRAGTGPTGASTLIE